MSFETSPVHISVTVELQTVVCFIILTHIDPRNIPWKPGRNVPEHPAYKIY
jgi:hypothetical protein